LGFCEEEIMDDANFGADLIRIHKAMTRGLRVSVEASAPDGGGAYPPPDLDGGLGRYVRALIAVLHVHHHGEDDLAWPYLEARMPDAPYEILTTQHATMSVLLEEAGAALSAGDVGSLHDQLNDVNALWREHIEREEDAFSVEATEDALTPEEQRQVTRKVERHAQLHSWPPRLVVPFMLYNLEPEDRVVLEKTIPGFVTKIVVPVVWKRAWAPMKPYLLDT
jgi:hemerythrin-like domain-containing protein